MKEIIKYIVIGGILLFALGIFFRGCAIVDDGATTIQKEFKPSTLLKKYEYFKDMSAAIDKKRADINMYQGEIAGYSVKDKDDRFYLEQRKSELIGIISTHNELCAEYNAAMSKFNYSFCNVGTLPAGAETPLPREIKPYINKLK
jgi:hypothetical protein